MSEKLESLKAQFLSTIGYGLRERLKEGYSFQNFISDLLSGIVVALIAIPLGMALAIASGVPPQQGLYTIVFGGVIVALLGGSRFQVTGPTAAFVVVLVPVVHQFGLQGLLMAGLMAGFLLFLMGLTGFGKFIRFIPHPVTTGFTSGIALVIATIQLKDFFGLKPADSAEGVFEKLHALYQARSTASFKEFLVAASTLALLVFWPKITKKVSILAKIPAPLFALALVSIVCAILMNLFPELQIATIGNQFQTVQNDQIISGIPRALPTITWPWQFEWNLSILKALTPAAFTIAILGAIESLLSATVADGMAHTRHNPDAELMGQGIANMVCPLFGGIPATGAIARTATNIRFGAQSPVSSLIHGVITLLVILIFAPVVSYLPMASLAALLMIVAYNMAEFKNFKHILKVGTRSDSIVLMICFLFTVIFNMVIGVTMGIVLASLLFMNRMSELVSLQILQPQSQRPDLPNDLPKDVMIYEIAGPFFFGAAYKAVTALNDIRTPIRIVIFLMDKVPTMDVSGLSALQSAVQEILSRDHRFVFFVCKGQPAEMIDRAEILKTHRRVRLYSSLPEAMAQIKHPASDPRSASSPLYPARQQS